MFHLKDGFFINREGENIVFTKKSGDVTEFTLSTNLEGFASMVATCTPFHESYGSWNYVLTFLKGSMRCAGCGKKMHKFQEIAPLCEPGPVCTGCFERWKPNFR